MTSLCIALLDHSGVFVRFFDVSTVWGVSRQSTDLVPWFVRSASRDALGAALEAALLPPLEPPMERICGRHMELSGSGRKCTLTAIGVAMQLNQTALALRMSTSMWLLWVAICAVFETALAAWLYVR